MPQKFSLPRGTSDLLPAEAFQWQTLEAEARAVLKRYGYREIRTPLFEETELFARSMGQTSDVVQKQMLNLASQKSEDEGGAALSGLSLRPEGTASIVRAYLENHLDHEEGLSKLYYIGPMFRGERPQKGRLRQFHQIGVEALGPGKAAGEISSAYLDAEVIRLSVHVLKSLGVDGFRLNINSLGSHEDKKNFSVFLRKRLKDDLKKFSAEDQQRFEQNIFRILDSKKTEHREVVRKLKFSGSDYLSAQSQEYFGHVKKCLKALEVEFEEDPALVRGLDYYTHTVFELSHPSLGSQDAVGAGGRYDSLIAQLGGDVDKNFGALGFALGIERMLLVSGRYQNLKAERGIFLVTMGPQPLERGYVLLDELRRAGVTANMTFHPGSMKSQMRMAAKEEARFVVILGEDELKSHQASIKDMDAGTQEQVPLDRVAEYLKTKM